MVNQDIQNHVSNCIKFMKINLPKKNYRINKIYYTTGENDFTYMKLKDN